MYKIILNNYTLENWDKSLLIDKINRRGEGDEEIIKFKMFRLRCLFILYSFQTEDEKEKKNSEIKNNLGFNKFDSYSLSKVIKSIEGGGFYDEDMDVFVKERLTKYSNQLANYANSLSESDISNIRNSMPFMKIVVNDKVYYVNNKGDIKGIYDYKPKYSSKYKPNNDLVLGGFKLIPNKKFTRSSIRDLPNTLCLIYRKDFDENWNLIDNKNSKERYEVFKLNFPDLDIEDELVEDDFEHRLHESKFRYTLKDFIKDTDRKEFEVPYKGFKFIKHENKIYLIIINSKNEYGFSKGRWMEIDLEKDISSGYLNS